MYARCVSNIRKLQVGFKSFMSQAQPSRGRGNGRGRGPTRGNVRGRGGFHSSQRENLPRDRKILGGLLPIEDSLRVSTTADTDPVTIEDLHYIGSYNWMDKQKPTILVPGSPPEWIDPSPPFFVPVDEGILYVNQNAFRMPKAPLQPLVLCVDEVTPEFDWSSVDFVTDRSNLRKFIRLISRTRKSTKPWRIDTQLAPGKKGTILLNRWERRDREMAGGASRGFAFEKHTTRVVDGCEGSSSHHRVVCYSLGELELVVRFEVDACLPASSASVVTKFGLTVKKGGMRAPDPSAVVELTTTGSAGRNADWKELHPQLYLSGTSHHFLALHQNRTFNNVQKRTLSTLNDAHGNETGENLGRLAAILVSVKELVGKYGSDGRISLVFDGKDREAVKVYQRANKGSCLPNELLRRFA
ncbi:hypothetical protein QCA50_011138 [Cerrena zonata]|uniref:Geranylgeranyl pyrophosphate synthetase n=1 Tax=Cerrena zonata TaxID=2478898 RepID=A0AAW0G097_9APHY